MEGKENKVEENIGAVEAEEDSVKTGSNTTVIEDETIEMSLDTSEENVEYEIDTNKDIDNIASIEAEPVKKVGKHKVLKVVNTKEEQKAAAREREETESLLETIIDIIADFTQAFIIVFVLTNFVLINANVPTSSMNNTIPTGARLFASRLHTALGEVKRGDIIIFKYPDNNDTIYVKRAIGLPGDTVEGKDGEVYVNGEKLDEPYIKEKIKTDFGPYTVPENSYFMLGDNRNNSRDSRYWKDTFVTRDEIMGKAIIQYYPEIKLIK